MLLKIIYFERKHAKNQYVIETIVENYYEVYFSYDATSPFHALEIPLPEFLRIISKWMKNFPSKIPGVSCRFDRLYLVFPYRIHREERLQFLLEDGSFQFVISMVHLISAIAGIQWDC